jgi:hypothetical protein
MKFAVKARDTAWAVVQLERMGCNARSAYWSILGIAREAHGAN